jgi:asparagine synthase (glutamine-hydrolysing)
MCGIVGFISWTNFNRLKDALPAAVSHLAHRGPDDSGIFFDEEAGVGLGHRRLSIIDVSSAGRQPMKSERGDVVIVYNGEVYNFKEIREALEGHSQVFRTATDTEVILKAYLQWGIACLERFVGMFALAIWDGRKRCLYLARDRYGIKPLYYHSNNGIFIFASEMKALMAIKDFPKDIDPDSIPLFFHYQYIPAPRTIFQNTSKLLPGHYAVFDGLKLRVLPYWKLPHGNAVTSRENQNEEDALEELDRVLTEAVRCCLVSDVPLGALLSGGIDSSVMVALMQKVNDSLVKTFSIGFREPSYNEAPWARKIAEYLGTDHNEYYVTPEEAMAVIPELPKIYDEPFGDASAIPTCLVSQIARSQVKVALSGDGGDEQFCGYVRYWSTQSIHRMLQRLPHPAYEFVTLLLKRLPAKWIERCYLPLRNYLPQRFQVTNFQEKWQKLLSLIADGGDLMELYRMTISQWEPDEILALVGKAVQTCQYEEMFRITDGVPILSRLMFVDQCTYLPDAMLTKVDRASMAVSLEVRVPLLDHRVGEYTAKLSDKLLYRNGAGKYLLKKLLTRYLPKSLFERPKVGFGVPIGNWLRHELKDLLRDYLSSSRLTSEGLFDKSLVEKTVLEHLSCQANHQDRLWYLLMWEMWRDHWLAR